MPLTRSLVAENSPYFESGAKLTYITRNNKWLFRKPNNNSNSKCFTNGNSKCSDDL